MVLCSPSLSELTQLTYTKSRKIPEIFRKYTIYKTIDISRMKINLTPNLYRHRKTRTMIVAVSHAPNHCPFLITQCSHLNLFHNVNTRHVQTAYCANPMPYISYTSPSCCRTDVQKFSKPLGATSNFWTPEGRHVSSSIMRATISGHLRTYLLHGAESFLRSQQIFS